MNLMNVRPWTLSYYGLILKVQMFLKVCPCTKVPVYVISDWAVNCIIK